jgi:hypothetical protein
VDQVSHGFFFFISKTDEALHCYSFERSLTRAVSWPIGR